jgi:hypothetical protein
VDSYSDFSGCNQRSKRAEQYVDRLSSRLFHIQDRNIVIGVLLGVFELAIYIMSFFGESVV